MTENKLLPAVRRIGDTARGKLSLLMARPALRTAAYGAARGAVGFVLSRARVMGDSAPFGLGWAAAAGGADIPGVLAALGCAGGYWSVRSVEATLLTAAVLIVFAAILLTMKALRKTWLRPAFALGAYILTALPYLISRGFEVSVLASFITNGALSFGCAHFFSLALLPKGEGEVGKQRNLGKMTLLLCCLMTLSGIRVARYMSLGRTLAVLLVMTASRAGGFGWGSAAGVGAGMGMDIALGEGPFFSMAYGFSGLVSGIFSERSRLACAVSYVTAGAAAALWAPVSGARLYLLYETFAASVIFMLIPERPFEEARLRLSPPSDNSGESLGVFWRERLKNSARAFRELHECLARLFASGKKYDADPARIFDRAADKVCKKCRNFASCWASPQSAARTAANDAIGAILAKKGAEKEDFHAYFISVCRDADAFVSAVDSQVKRYLEQRSRRERQKEDSKLLCRQYSELSHILSECAEEFSGALVFDGAAQLKIKKLVSDLGIGAKVTVYRGEHSRLHVELDAEDLSQAGGADAMAKELSRLMGTKMCLGEEIRTGELKRWRFLQTEPMRAIAGAASGRRTGEETSGDSATYFKTRRGELFVLLSDGMGSGPEAAKESRLTLGVIERFLRAGVSPGVALRTVDSALLLKNREDGGFATLDLLQLDLFTLECSIYKFGAAPSYIKRGSTVKRADGCSLPIGTGAMQKNCEQSKFILKEGDFIVLASDGLADRDDDGWVVSLLAQYSGNSPRELAAALLKEGARRSGCADDITVYALRVEKAV